VTTPRTPSKEVLDAIAHGREYELDGGPDAVLLLHGLTGATFEMHHLALRLWRAGYRCLAPVMAGHGGGPEDLLGVPWTEWVAKARRDLTRLAGARRTFVAGSSMGALVACALAHDVPERVDGLALLAPAMELKPAGRLAGLLGRTGLLWRVVVPKGSGSDVHDAEMRRRNPCMNGVPLAAVAELEALSAYVDRAAPGIAAPAIVMAGAKDHTVTLGGARRLARRLGSGPSELVVLPQSFHLVGVDVERDACAEAVARFFAQLPVPGQRRARPEAAARLAAVAQARAGGARAASRTRRRPRR
jgi:carboxylesterase